MATRVIVDNSQIALLRARWDSWSQIQTETRGEQGNGAAGLCRLAQNCLAGSWARLSLRGISYHAKGSAQIAPGRSHVVLVVPDYLPLRSVKSAENGSWWVSA